MFFPAFLGTIRTNAASNPWGLGLHTSLNNEVGLMTIRNRLLGLGVVIAFLLLSTVVWSQDTPVAGGPPAGADGRDGEGAVGFPEGRHDRPSPKRCPTFPRKDPAPTGSEVGRGPPMSPGSPSLTSMARR